jgi:hypothetical protein
MKKITIISISLLLFATQAQGMRSVFDGLRTKCTALKSFAFGKISAVEDTMAEGKAEQEEPRKVLMFHCTQPENIPLLLRDGLKSRSQLVKEGIVINRQYKGDVPSDGLDPWIYFQHQDPEYGIHLRPGLTVRKLRPYVWELSDRYSRPLQCVAIEVDPTKTHVYNRDFNLRTSFREYNTRRDLKCVYENDCKKNPNPSVCLKEHQAKLYQQSRMPLSMYLEHQTRVRRVRNSLIDEEKDRYDVIAHPITAEPIKIKVSYPSDNPNGYWEEMIVKRDIIPPSEFVA